MEQYNISTTRLFFSALFFAAFGGLVLLAVSITGNEPIKEKATVLSEEKSRTSEQNPFSKISLDAKAALVWDIKKEKILFSKNHETQLPLASLTKIMTALIALETLPHDATIIVGKEAIQGEGDEGLLVGERWPLKALTDFTLLASSNDGAKALALAVSSRTPFEDRSNGRQEPVPFEALMNRKASEIGLSQTFFINESGLDPAQGVSGAYGSAYDVAILFSYILKHQPGLFEVTQYSKREFVSLDGKHHEIKNTNEYVEQIPGILGSKTGFTDLAGGNLAIVFEAGPGYPIVVLALGSTRDGRFEDVRKLVWTTLESP